jgi:hypothetical protein
MLVLKMKWLIFRAVETGITILNEVGLDPGIDHLLAMECFDEVHQAGGKVESLISFCGGEYDYCMRCVPAFFKHMYTPNFTDFVLTSVIKQAVLKKL